MTTKRILAAFCKDFFIGENKLRNLVVSSLIRNFAG